MFWRLKLLLISMVRSILRRVVTKGLWFFDSKHMLVLVIVVMIRLVLYLQADKIGFAKGDLAGQEGDFVASIAEEPKEDHATVDVIFDGFVISGMSVEGRVISEIPRLPFKEYGMECQGYGVLSIPESFGDFDYREYLRHKGIYYVLDIKSITCLQVDSGAPIVRLRRRLVELKNHLIDRIEWVMPEPHSSLLAGVLFGEERVFTEGFSDALRITGTTHIVAASGYNVTLVVMLIDRILMWVRFKLRTRLTVSLVGIWIYSMMSGLSLSIVRASLMLSIVLLIKLMGIQKIFPYIVLLSVAVIVVFVPGALFSVSYQLSMLATLGLVYVHPMFTGDSDGNSERSFWKEYFLTTFVATLATAPVLLVTFGEISFLGLFANVLILPVLESTMLIGG